MAHHDSMIPLQRQISLLFAASKSEGRNLALSGDPHYQPAFLRPIFGYDQRIGWQIIVSFNWMRLMAEHYNDHHALGSLTPDLLERLFSEITTTAVTELERRPKEEGGTGHDILALLSLMRRVLPTVLHQYLHLTATSYDIISTAYALQTRVAVEALYHEGRLVSAIMREHIAAQFETVQMGRTHLQAALPITIGFWLACLHNRCAECLGEVRRRALLLEVKFSGAVGTKASQMALGIPDTAENLLGALLQLAPRSTLSTQIPAPEKLMRVYHELALLSGALANLGEDVRLLQMSAIGEVGSASSTSSAMAHKTSNPVAAENLAGMHGSVLGAYQTLLGGLLVSDLQRDLRNSSLMRGSGALFTFVGQQLLTAKRLLRSLSVDASLCSLNFKKEGGLLSTAELLHLALQRAGVSGSHTFVNQEVVPLAQSTGSNLWEAAQSVTENGAHAKVQRAMEMLDPAVVDLIRDPFLYTGTAATDALFESRNELPEWHELLE